MIDTTVQFRTTVRIISDEGYEGQNSDSWYNRHGPRDNRKCLIEPILMNVNRCGSSELEFWFPDRFSVLWDFWPHESSSIPFRLNFENYSGSLCRLDITTEHLAHEPMQSENYLLAYCMVDFTTKPDLLDHSRLPTLEKLHKPENQITTLKKEVRSVAQSSTDLVRPSRNRSSSVSSRSSSTNSTLRGPAEFDASEQLLDPDEPSVLPQVSLLTYTPEILAEGETAKSDHVLPPPPVTIGSQISFTCYICEAIVRIGSGRQWEYVARTQE